MELGVSLEMGKGAKKCLVLKLKCNDCDDYYYYTLLL